MTLKISPSVGIARLGNSRGQFCLAPDSIGGLPFEADPYGDQAGPIQNFKDDAGQVRRQGQAFKIFQQDGTELTLNSPNVKSIEWTVHLANKKAAWYNYSELNGNLLYGRDNSYSAKKVELRNPSKETEAERQALIVDPGPRSIAGCCQTIDFSEQTVPGNYSKASFPPKEVQYGTPIHSLGDLKTDSEGRLVVLGGQGNAGGNEPLISYGGSSSWHDDISDGPVYCTVTLEDGSVHHLKAWVIVGSPDFAPEIVNISTLDDSMLDVAVRKFDLVPEMYSNRKYNENFIANFERDILPIINRFSRYQWVANVQSMTAFSSNAFDYSDNSEKNLKNRELYFSYFRQPDDKTNPLTDQPQQTLFRNELPMMPMNSGSNSVSNENVVKFLALNETQYFLFGQWAKGQFENNPDYQNYPVDPKDQASVGNCVGLPMCPGIEVTWSVQNANIYSSAYTISDTRGKEGYNTSGLTPLRDECEGGGCEPGDLTKRMACPWQADFFQCTVQPVNFTVSTINKSEEAPLPPTYYSYWWPPQSPWDVLTGELTEEGQAESHLPAGQQMNYARGINNFVQMVEHWSALAFIRDSNPEHQSYPYFTETERNNELFTYKEVGMDTFSGNPEDRDTTLPIFYIEKNTRRVKLKSNRAKSMVEALEKRSFKPIKVQDKGLGMPRSGTRMRR